jgi:hypothetical protein
MSSRSFLVFVQDAGDIGSRRFHAVPSSGDGLYRIYACASTFVKQESTVSSEKWIERRYLQINACPFRKPVVRRIKHIAGWSFKMEMRDDGRWRIPESDA